LLQHGLLKKKDNDVDL